MPVVRPFRGPIIDRDCFDEASGLGLPERFASSVPYFDVIRDNDPMGPRWRFNWDFKRNGWVWQPKGTVHGRPLQVQMHENGPDGPCSGPGDQDRPDAVDENSRDVYRV